MGGLPFSKELYPVDVSDDPDIQKPRPVIEFVLDDMRRNGIDRIFVVVRDGKWDIPRYLGDGSRFNLSIAYLMMGRPFGVPFSLDQGYDYVHDQLVALGFPDILVGSPDAFGLCLAEQEQTGADIVVGSLPTDFPQGVDMLEMAADNKVAKFVIKPQATSLTHAWPLAVWTPVFTSFLHEFLRGKNEPPGSGKELQVADVFNAAISAGLDVRAVPISNHPFVDIGSPGGLARFAHQRQRLLSA